MRGCMVGLKSARARLTAPKQKATEQVAFLCMSDVAALCCCLWVYGLSCTLPSLRCAVRELYDVISSTLLVISPLHVVALHMHGEAAAI